MKHKLTALVLAMLATSAFATTGNNGEGNGGCGVGQTTNGCGSSATTPVANVAGGNASSNARANASAQANNRIRNTNVNANSNRNSNRNTNAQGQLQGQAQQQQQTITGTGNSNNVNTNTANGGLGGAGGNATGGDVTNSGNSNTQNANNSNQNVTVNGDRYRAAASTAYAPGLTATNGTCLGSAGVGANGMNFGLSLGSTKKDEECNRRYNSIRMQELGQTDAAVAIMCQDASVRQAMKDVGRPCPPTPEEQRAEAERQAAERGEYTDPYIRARLKMAPL